MTSPGQMSVKFIQLHVTVLIKGLSAKCGYAGYSTRVLKFDLLLSVAS